MADSFDPLRRSEIMARIRGHGNAATEMRLIALFRAIGIKGWRRRQSVFGKPDFVFPGRQIAVFVDGDFWHGHPTRGKIPATNTEFWAKKIARNKARDVLVNKTLRASGWQVIRFWQSELSSPACLRRLRRLAKALAAAPGAGPTAPLGVRSEIRY